MKKSFFLLVPAAFGLLALTACDESTTSGSTTTQSSACSLNPSETGLEITCNNESFGFLKTSSGGVYGSCGAEALRDDSGYKLVCGGDSVGVVYNGKAGRNGVPGENGQPGQPGEKGDPGDKGDAGSSCSAKQVTTGFEIYCGDVKVGTVLNGANGYSCSVKAGTTTSTATINCEDGSKATLNAIQGIQGVAGENCTTSGLRKTETSVTSDYYGQTYSEVTCDGETIKVYDGKSIQGEKGDKGDDGVGCSAVKNATTGNITITCGAGDDETSVVITKPLDGAAGAKGDNCSIKDNEDGTATITCGTGTGATTYIVKDGANGAAGKNGKSCSIADNEDGTATITCETDDPEAPATYTVKNGANGNPGAKGDAGYSCSSTAGAGYVDVKCQTGVDEDENPVYTTNRILAAGYVECGDGVYESSKGKCTGNEDDGFEWVAYTCGTSTVALTATQFCYEGQVYAHNDYWDESNVGLKYPVTDYDSLGSGKIVLKADYCDYANNKTDYPKTEYFEEAGDCYAKADYWTEATTYPKDSYGQCGAGYYAVATEFCSAYNTVVEKCGTAEYDPANQYCVVSGSEPDLVYTVTNNFEVCGPTELYNTRTHFCWESTQTVYPRCDGLTYDPTAYNCFEGEVTPKE